MKRKKVEGGRKETDRHRQGDRDTQHKARHAIVYSLATVGSYND